MSPKTRERYAVLLIPEGVISGSFDPGPPLDLGVPSKWVSCGISRALALRYAADESEKLPQAKTVKSVLTAWAKGRGLKKIRVAVLDSLDETGIESLLQAWDTRRGLIGSNVTLSYPVVLLKTARDSSTNVSVDLNQRLGWLAEKALPWINQRLGELHREDTLEAAPGPDLRRFIHRWKPFLIYHQDKEVRPCRQSLPVFLTAVCCNKRPALPFTGTILLSQMGVTRLFFSG